MITVDELMKLEKGTIIYVAASGIGKGSNNLIEEEFESLRQVSSGDHHLMVKNGGYSLKNSLRQGVCLFLNKDEAVEYMIERHNRLYNNELSRITAEISKLKMLLDKMYNDGPGEPDYIFLGRH